MFYRARLETGRPELSMALERGRFRRSFPPSPPAQVETTSAGAVTHAAGVLLTRTAEANGLRAALAQGLALSREPPADSALADLVLSRPPSFCIVIEDPGALVLGNL